MGEVAGCGGGGHHGAVTEAVFARDDRPAGIDGVETTVFDGEAVLFHEATSMLHRLGAVAAAAWLLADGETTVDSMIGEIAEAFDATAADVEAPLDEALASLAGEGLLVGHDGPMRVHLQPVDDVASDGTKILAAPPDP
jgi:hypothetical protein